MTKRLLAWAFGLSVALNAQTTEIPASIPTVLSVCQALSKALQYDGTLVRIRDVMRGTEEGSWFVGDDCPNAFAISGYNFPSLIWLRIPDNSPPQLHPVDFQYSFESQRKLVAKYEQLKREVGADCIAWTYTGVFETRRDWAAAEAKTIDPGRLRGFGHLSAAPAQLILKSADDVTVIENCTPKPKNKQIPLPG